jgi:predicted GNAT family acetyltransferase
MEYCLAEPNMNLFILGDVEIFGFNSSFQDVWCQILQDKLTGIVLRHQDNMIIYSRNLDMDFGEVKPLLETHKVRIVSGKNSVVDVFYPLIESRYSRREMAFCEQVDMSTLVDNTSQVIEASEADAMEIAEAYGQIHEFAGLYASDLNQRYEMIVNRINSKEGKHLFIRVDGKIVSHANSAAETSVNGMLGGIMTLPEFRNRGLASKIISALCKDLAHRGKSACLFHDNPEAASVFRRLGFQETGKWVILEDRHEKTMGIKK